MTPYREFVDQFYDSHSLIASNSPRVRARVFVEILNLSVIVEKRKQT